MADLHSSLDRISRPTIASKEKCFVGLFRRRIRVASEVRLHSSNWTKQAGLPRVFEIVYLHEFAECCFSESFEIESTLQCVVSAAADFCSQQSALNHRLLKL